MRLAGVEIDAKAVMALPTEARKRFLAKWKQREELIAQRLYYHLYPERDSVWEGPTVMKGLIERRQTIYARTKYARHMEFFEAGARYRERCAMCANRVGKTFGMGGYEMAAHLTGEYPDWWPGRRFAQPISAYAAGKGFETTRDIMQLTLFGQVKQGNGRKGVDGRGVVPGHLIGDLTWKSGVSNLIDTIAVKHVPTGGWSYLTFKSYEQGRGSFEGTGQHVIWLDEEPPEDVYGECLIRTATTKGLVMITFTPLEGMSKVVMGFLPQEMRPQGG